MYIMHNKGDDNEKDNEDGDDKVIMITIGITVTKYNNDNTLHSYLAFAIHS